MINHELIKESVAVAEQLYKNDVKAFLYIPKYICELEKVLMDNGAALNDNFFKEGIEHAISSLWNNYNAQSVIGLADAINAYIIPLLKEERESFYISDTYKKKHLVNIDNFEKNKKSIPQFMHEYYDGFLNINVHDLDNDEKIYIDEEGNMAVNENGEIVYLNSSVDPERACELWIGTIQEIKYFNTVIICGMSNCEYIRSVLKKIPDKTPVIVYEPERKIFEYNFIYTDMSDLLSKENCYFVVEDINLKHIKIYIDSFISFVNIDKVLIYSLPGYDVLYYDKIKKFEKLCKSYLTEIKINNNSIIRMCSQATENIIKNMRFLVGGTDILRVKNKIQKYDVENIPAIVVAAGPSLDKNLKYLRDAKGKAFILAVDSAIRMMLQYDIMPDAIVTLDPDKPRVLFESNIINDVPFFYSVHATYDAIKNNRNRLVLYNNSRYLFNVLKRDGKESGVLETGGSVACSAFSIARYLGFKNIIVIGQDLAFTDNKKHASVVYDEAPVSEAEKEKYTMIEGADGSELLTYINLKAYRDWYEDRILQDDELHMINATEGGALIHGAEHMRLEDAIKQYCKKNFNFEIVIENVELIYGKDEIDKIKEIYNNSIKNCSKIKQYLNTCKEEYVKMGMDRSESSNINSYNIIKRSLNDVYSYDETDLIDNFTRKTQNIESVGIYEIEEDEDIWKDTSKRGINIIDSFLKGADEVIELFKKGLENISLYEKDINV